MFYFLKELYLRLRFPWLFSFLPTFFHTNDFYRYIEILSIKSAYFCSPTSLIPINYHMYLPLIVNTLFNTSDFTDLNKMQLNYLKEYLNTHKQYICKFIHEDYPYTYTLRFTYDHFNNCFTDVNLFLQSIKFDDLVVQIYPLNTNHKVCHNKLYLMEVYKL